MSKNKNPKNQAQGRSLDEFVLKNLNLIAERLPIIPIKTKDNKGIPQEQEVYGSQLIEEGISELEGKKIIPGKKYWKSLGNVNVNHLEALKTAWLQGGDKKVNEYCDQFKTQL